MFLEEDSTSAEAAELTKQSLVDTQARMGMMLDLMPMGLLIHTEQGILYANQEARRLLKVSQGEIVGRHFLDFLQTQVDEAEAQMKGAFEGRMDLKTTEVEIKTDDGVARTIKLIAGALPWDGNPVVQLLLQDITDLKEIQETLHRLAVTDELTGVFNRRHAFAVAKQIFANAVDPDHPFSIAVLDIDHFKRINDNYGHASGDIALQTLTRTIRDMIGDNVTFARIGGEEFMLLFPDKSTSQARVVCEAIRKAVEKQPVASPEGVFGMTVSIGIDSRRVADVSFEALFSRADSALYEAKETGRNKVCAARMARATSQTRAS